MNKKKILYIITKGSWGGAQRYIYDLAISLQRDKYEIVVAAGEAGEQGALFKKLSEGNIRTIKLTNAGRNIHLIADILLFFELVKLIIKEKPDILHLNSSKVGGIGSLSGRIAGCENIVFTAHGWPFKEDRFILVRLFIYISTWITVLFSHRVIVVSEQDKDLGYSMWFVKNKIKHIPITLQVPHFLPRKKAEEILSIPEPGIDLHIINSVRLVTIAELTKNKGVRFGIEMMKELEKKHPGKYTYTIFGKGEELSNLQNEVNGLLNSNDQPIVIFRSININLPANLSTEASLYLRAFDIFILPSIKEGMPYVLLEANEAGLPIIATDAVKSITSYIPHIHIVPSKSGKALASKVEEVAHSMQTKEVFQTKNTFQKMLEKTIKVYENL